MCRSSRHHEYGVDHLSAVCVRSEVTCQVQQLVAGLLTTPYDVAFDDVIGGECPDGGGRMLMDNGLSSDAIKCTAYGRRGLLDRQQSGCTVGELVK